MMKLKEKILGTDLPAVADMHADELFTKDETYQNDCRDLEEIKSKYEALEINEHVKMIIEDYIACMRSACERESELCYKAGLRDAVDRLKEMGFLKE